MSLPLPLVERECGECSACCEIFAVGDLVKPPYTPCNHQTSSRRLQDGRSPENGENPPSGENYPSWLKPGPFPGAPCGTGGCGIHPRRPKECREFKCLWLEGKLPVGDRPDSLGVVFLDILNTDYQGKHAVAAHEWEVGSALSPRVEELIRELSKDVPVFIYGPDGGSVVMPRGK